MGIRSPALMMWVAVFAIFSSAEELRFRQAIQAMAGGD
jgi:hypothetical protein